MERRLGVFRLTVGRVIREDLALKSLKKPEAKRLSDAIIGKRKSRAKNFHKLVSEKLEYVITLAEAWLTLDYRNGQETHYYDKKKKSERTRHPPVATSAPQFCDQVMFAAGFSMEGKTRLYFILKKTKVFAEAFVK